MKTSVFAALTFLIATGAASAQQPAASACGAELARFKQEWNAIGLPEGSKPAARVTAQGGHSHTEAEIDIMMGHARKASQLCAQGKGHEAMLHMDLVRAWLKLPDIPHPAAHKYQLK